MKDTANAWQDKYKLLEEELKQARKETAEKLIKLVYATLTDRKVWVEMHNWWLEGKECPPLKNLLDELAKQVGVELEK